MADQVRVFVSHHHSPEEDAFTARLVADLEAAGADVWVDTSGITSDDFVKKISEGLAGRQWLVLVMTQAALASPWVQREVNAALNEHTAGRMLGVLPLVMHPCQEHDIPLLWRPLHRIDATRDYQAALAGVLRAFGLAAPAGQTAPPPTSSAQPSMPPDRFPPRLASLGYQARVINGVEVILPPLCYVPAGEFLMGSDPKTDKWAGDNEEPQHWVTLPAYQIARFPVTVAEYACFVGSGHVEPQSEYNKLTWQQQREWLDHSVVNVPWHAAVAYAARLSNLTGQPWQLPSEAEWEKAARWDSATRTSYTYPWGDSFDARRCNTSESGVGTTTPVGSYLSGVSPCGAQDMAGNVWEWTSSLVKPYPYRARDGREALDSADERVLRGGSWVYDARYARAAFRSDYQPVGAYGDAGGFRMVRAAFG